MVPQGCKEPDGTDFTDKSGLGQGKGYFDAYDEAIEANYAKAMGILRKYYDYDENSGMLTNFKPMTFLYSNGEDKESIGVYLQGALEEIGITLNLENQENNTFLSNRGSGNYQIAWGSWFMDYLDPIDILTLCLTRSNNDSCQVGKGSHADVAAYSLDLTDEGIDVAVKDGTWAETYDVLIDAIRGEADDERRSALMHKAEDFVMASGIICPLYYGKRPNLLRKDVEGFWISPLGIASFAGCASKDGRSSLSVCLGGEPDSLDPGVVDTINAATMCTHMFSGLARCVPDDSGKGMDIVADCAEGLVEGVANEDGTYTYTYTLRDDLTWSDGMPVTAHDFEFGWKRSASPELGSNYRELFESIKGFEDNDLVVSALDDRTFEVILQRPVGYWDQLLAFPAFYPMRSDVVSNDNWANEASTYVGNGAFELSSWEHDSVIAMRRRPDFHRADEVTMDELVWYLSDNAVTNLNNYESGSWDYITDIPRQETERLETEYADEYHVASTASAFFLMFNATFDMLPS